MAETLVAIGIDLGTSLARVAVFRSREPELVAFGDGALATPAVVSYAGGTPRVGRTALAKATTHPADTVRGVKRLLGRQVDDPVVVQVAERSPFPIKAGPHGGIALEVGKVPKSPEDVAVLLLASLAEAVERAVGARPETAVLTVPYWYGPKQRAALSDATRKAGFIPQQIVSEATATALSLLDGGGERLVAIVDVGAGGCTASILELSPARVRLVATNGDPLGGGDDVDAKLVRAVLRGLRGKLGEFPDSPWITEMLRQACEALKRELIHTASAATTLPFLPIGAGVNNQRISIERETADALMRDTVSRIGRACSNALESAGISKQRLAAVHVTGGLTRMAAVRAAVERSCGPISSRKIDPDGAVALGAAHQAAMLDGLADAIAVIDVQTMSSVAPPPMSGRMTLPPVRIHTPAPARLSSQPEPVPPSGAQPRTSATPRPVTPSVAPDAPPPSAQDPLRPRASATPLAAPDGAAPRGTPGVKSATPTPEQVNPNEFRSELASLLAALRAGAVTDASTEQAGRKLVARANDITAEEANVGADERERMAERLAGFWTLCGLVLQAARQYRWEHTQTERQLDRAFEELGALLALAPRSVVWDVGTTRFAHHGHAVWKPDRPPYDRVPYDLFADGVRKLQLKEGATRDELRELLGVLTRDAAFGFGPDDDAATAMFSRKLPHVGWLVVDAFADGDDPEFEAARDELAKDLADLASAEGAAVLGTYAESRRRVSETTSRLALDEGARAALTAAVAPAQREWVSRFASGYLELEREAERSGEADALKATFDTWAEEQLRAHAPKAVLELFLTLDDDLANRGEDALPSRGRASEALLPVTRVRTMLEELRAVELSEGHVEALRRALGRGRDEALVGAAIHAYPVVSDPLQQALVDLVLVPAASSEADLGPLLAVAKPEHAIHLLRALRAAAGEGPRPRRSAVSLAPLEAGQVDGGWARANAALAFAFRSTNLDVRLEALSLLPHAPPDNLREEIRKLVEDGERDARLRVLRCVIDRKIGATGDTLTRRVRDRVFHDLDDVERALLLEALAAGDRRRAETVALELLELQGLFRGESVERTRAIAADFLAGSDSLEVLDALQRVTKRWFTSGTLRDSATRAAETVARRRSTPRPERA